jgi:hypothetical protein
VQLLRENKIEKHFCDCIKQDGGIAYKFVSPGVNGVPDRIVLKPIPLKLQKLIAKYIYFVELKAPRKKPNVRQKEEHAKLRALGFTVKVIDSKRC